MKRLLCLAPVLLLAACASTPRTATPGPTGPTAAWLAGTWLMMDEQVEHPAGCDSGLPIAYSSDGRYTLFEESGIWRLEGGRLTETATMVHENADPADGALGRAFVSRIERSGPDSLRKTFADGSTATFLRCPKRR